MTSVIEVLLVLPSSRVTDAVIVWVPAVSVFRIESPLPRRPSRFDRQTTARLEA